MSWTPFGKGHTHYWLDEYMEYVKDKWISAGMGQGEQKIEIHECLKCGDIIEHKMGIYRRKE